MPPIPCDFEVSNFYVAIILSWVQTSAHSSNAATTNIGQDKIVVADSGKCCKNMQRTMITFTWQTNKAMTNSHPNMNIKSLCNVEKTDKNQFVARHESTATSLLRSCLMHVCCGSKRTNICCDHVPRCHVRAVRARLDPALVYIFTRSGWSKRSGFIISSVKKIRLSTFRIFQMASHFAF